MGCLLRRGHFYITLPHILRACQGKRCITVIRENNVSVDSSQLLEQNIRFEPNHIKHVRLFRKNPKLTSNY